MGEVPLFSIRFLAIEGKKNTKHLLNWVVLGVLSWLFCKLFFFLMNLFLEAREVFPTCSTACLVVASQDPSGVLCPVLGSPVQESWRATGKSPAEGYKDDEGTGASLL